jgi:hypothetical protein
VSNPPDPLVWIYLFAAVESLRSLPVSFAVCIHGRTVSPSEPLWSSCSDCEELEQLRRAEYLLRIDDDCTCVRRATGLHVDDIDPSCPTHGRDPYTITSVLARLDAIRTRRGPGSLGACTCSPCPMVVAPTDIRCESRVEHDDGWHRDPACPQHGARRGGA